MTDATFLKTYRDMTQELAVLDRQLALCGTTGRPASAASFYYDDIRRSTNDPTAAAIQQQEGIEQARNAKQAELDAMQPRFDSLMKRARNFKERAILWQYYRLCYTDAQIAECLDVSTRHANRLRKELLTYLDDPSNMSAAVVACHAPA